jgi:hypothetical protein
MQLTKIRRWLCILVVLSLAEKDYLHSMPSLSTCVNNNNKGGYHYFPPPPTWHAYVFSLDERENQLFLFLSNRSIFKWLYALAYEPLSTILPLLFLESIVVHIFLVFISSFISYLWIIKWVIHFLYLGPRLLVFSSCFTLKYWLWNGIDPMQSRSHRNV